MERSKSRVAAMDAKRRILDQAEQLFAEHGFAATSLRMIRAAIQVNLAAVNHHFRSKEALMPAVLARRHPAQSGVNFQRLMGRMHAEPGQHLQAVMREQFAEVAARFTAALQKAAPELPPVELSWRIHFMVGAMAHTLAGSHYLELAPGGVCDPSDVEGTVERLVRFLAAGLRAPADDRRWRTHA